MLAIRESRFKLVLNFSSPQEQLFDLECDPGELHPLPQGRQKGVQRRLLEIARNHLRESVHSRNWKLRMAARLRDVRLEWAHSTP